MKLEDLFNRGDPVLNIVLSVPTQVAFISKATRADATTPHRSPQGIKWMIHNDEDNRLVTFNMGGDPSRHFCTIADVWKAFHDPTSNPEPLRFPAARMDYLLTVAHNYLKSERTPKNDTFWVGSANSTLAWHVSIRRYFRVRAEVAEILNISANTLSKKPFSEYALKLQPKTDRVYSPPKIILMAHEQGLTIDRDVWQHHIDIATPRKHR